MTYGIRDPKFLRWIELGYHRAALFGSGLSVLKCAANGVTLILDRLQRSSKVIQVLHVF